MAATQSLATTGHRPTSVLATIGVLLFLGISAVAGAAALLLGVGAPPGDWLDQVPVVDSWTVPGLVLGIGFGLGSLVTAYGLLRRPGWPWLGFVQRVTGHHWSWAATILIGLGQVCWIARELVYLPGLSALQVVYGGVGLALVLLPMQAPVRTYLRAA